MSYPCKWCDAPVLEPDSSCSACRAGQVVADKQRPTDGAAPVAKLREALMKPQIGELDPAAWAKASAAAGAKPVEFDPTGRPPNTPGAKLDAGKVPLLRGCLRYFPRALASVAVVSEHGAKKYTWNGWETVPDGITRYGDAMLRHVAAESFEEFDKDSRILHAAHAAWNALARLELMLRQTERKQ